MSRIKTEFWDEIEQAIYDRDKDLGNGEDYRGMPAQVQVIELVKEQPVTYPIITDKAQNEMVRTWLKQNHAESATIAEHKHPNGATYELNATAKLAWGETTPCKLQVVCNGLWRHEEGKEYTLLELVGQREEQ